MRRACWIVALSAMLALNACGFHLQQQAQLPAQMAQVSMVIQNPNSTFARRLVLLLEQNGANVVTGEFAGAILEVPVNQVRKEILTIGDNARVREYRIHHAVQFRLLDPAGKILVQEQTLEQSRVISFDEQDILGAAQEEEFLRKNLADNLARMVLRRLASSGP